MLSWGAAHAQHTPQSAWNRYIAIHASALQSRYHETDARGRTADGVLNRENGSVEGWGGELRWQSAGQGWRPFVGLHMQQHRGDTRYQGYLQYADGALAPYRATTGNTFTRLSAQLGAGRSFAQWHIVPHIALERQRWQRRLVQYDETFTHTAAMLGVLLQHPIGPQWLIEADGAAGRSLRARMAAPLLGFEQSLGAGGIWQAGLRLHCQAHPHIPYTAGLQHRQWRHGPSPLQNTPAGRLQEPEGQSRQSLFFVAAAWQY